MSFFSDLFGKDDTSTGSTADESAKTESTQTSSFKTGSSSSFWSDLLGNGGAGSSLISSAGGIGLGLVKNDGAKIQSDYQLKMAELTNRASLDTAQFKLEVDKLNQEREAALAAYSDQKRNDGLLALGIVGGLITLVLIAYLVIRNRTPKKPA